MNRISPSQPCKTSAIYTPHRIHTNLECPLHNYRTARVHCVCMFTLFNSAGTLQTYPRCKDPRGPTKLKENPRLEPLPGKSQHKPHRAAASEDWATWYGIERVLVSDYMSNDQVVLKANDFGSLAAHRLLWVSSVLGYSLPPSNFILQPPTSLHNPASKGRI